MGNTKYTLNSNFCPKPVAELITTKHHFVIPSYQRGYRWEEKQVVDLLEDICGFAKQVFYVVVHAPHTFALAEGRIMLTTRGLNSFMMSSGSCFTIIL